MTALSIFYLLMAITILTFVFYSIGPDEPKGENKFSQFMNRVYEGMKRVFLRIWETFKMLLFASLIVAVPALIVYFSFDMAQKETAKFRPTTWTGEGVLRQILDAVSLNEHHIKVLEYKMEMMFWGIALMFLITTFIFAILIYNKDDDKKKSKRSENSSERTRIPLNFKKTTFFD